MMTLKELKNEMNGSMFDFSREQLEEVWKSVSNEYDTIEEVEDEYEHDFITLFDVNLGSLLDYLQDDGYDESKIVEMISAHYGNCIDICYCKDDDMYAMCIGVR